MTEAAVKLHVLKGPRVPQTAGHPFLCEHFRGTLTGSECLRRQTLRMKAPSIAKDQSGRVPQHLEYCASGKCDQGAEIAKTFPKWKPDDRPPMDWQAQWTAKRRHDAVDPPLLGPAPKAEQLKREVADVVLSMKKPTWREWKAEKDKKRDEMLAPEPVEHEPHPLSNRGMEESMEGMRPCSVEHCKQQITPANKSGKCRWCASKIPLGSPAHGRLWSSQQPKNGKPRAPRLDGLRGATAIEGRKKEISGIKSSHDKPAITGQDEFDLMIAIRDQFRKLSTDGQRYVLAALKS